MDRKGGGSSKGGPPPSPPLHGGRIPPVVRTQLPEKRDEPKPIYSKKHVIVIPAKMNENSIRTNVKRMKYEMYMRLSGRSFEVMNVEGDFSEVGLSSDLGFRSKLEDLGHIVQPGLLDGVNHPHGFIEALNEFKDIVKLAYYLRCLDGPDGPTYDWVSSKIVRMRAKLGFGNIQAGEESSMIQMVMNRACTKLSTILSTKTYFIKLDGRDYSSPTTSDTRFLVWGRILTTLKDSMAYEVFVSHHNLLGFVERFPPTLNNAVTLSSADSKYLIDYVKGLNHAPLGRGAHAEVYEANFECGNQWGILPGKYAVKITSANGSKYHDAEVNVLTKFNHPNIMKLYAHGFEDQFGVSVSVLQLGGKTLHATLLQEGSGKSLNWYAALKLTKDVAYTLHLLHSLNDVHRYVYQDFKEDNFLLDEDNNPFLIDFGLVDESIRGIIPVGGNIYCRYILGTDGAAKRPRMPTQMDDVYALGALLIVLTTDWKMAGPNSSIVERIFVCQRNGTWNVSDVFSSKMTNLPDFHTAVAENILKIIKRCVYSEINAYEVADELKGLLSYMTDLLGTQTSSGAGAGPSRLPGPSRT